MDDITEATELPADPSPPTQIWAQPLRGAWALFRQRPGLWLLLAAPGAMNIAASGLWAAGVQSNPNSALQPRGAGWSGSYCVLLILALITFLASLLMMVAMARQLLGDPVDRISTVWGRVVERLGTFFRLGCVASLVLGVSSIALSVVVAQSKMGSSVAAAPPLMATSIQLFSLVMIVVLARLGFAFESLLLGRDAVIASFERSWRLTRGKFWRMVGYRSLAVMPFYIGTVSRHVLLPGLDTAHPPWSLVTTGLRSAYFLVWTPYTTALFILLWYRLRTEQEGLDIATAMAELVSPAGALPTTPDDAAPPDAPRSRRRGRRGHRETSQRP